METFSLLSQGQHGFRQKKSCETALIQLFNLLFRARRKKLYICVVMLDYSKAFDTLNPHYIIKVLQAYHIDDVCLNWFTYYLTGRLQRTKYSETFFDTLPVTSGVPQGSVLGSTIFNSFLNQLLQALNLDNFFAYADDISFIAHGISANSALQSMLVLLDAVYVWFDVHCLSINTGKCFYMIVSPYARKRFTCTKKLVFGSSALPIVDKIKILGIYCFKDLSWRHHVSHVRKKVISMAGVLNRFGSTLNCDTSSKVFCAFVKPHLLFALLVWGNAGTGSITTMDHTIFQAVCIILRSRSATLVKETAAALDIISFEF